MKNYNKIMQQLEDENSGLRKAFKDMPEVELTFNTAEDWAAWNNWKTKYFNTEGYLKLPDVREVENGD